MYRKVEGQVYTRKEYMGGIPHCRISQFDTGNVHQTYRFHYSIVAREAAQVRDQSVEAARVAVVREMERVASNNFHFKVRKYPHNILREHKMATGAGADRISDGMRLAFGKPVGHAVRANIGDVLFTLSFRSENQDSAVEALRKAACKLPMPTSVERVEDTSVVEGPRAAPIVIAPAPEKPAEEAAEGEAAAPAEGEEKAEKGEKGAAPAKGAAAPAKGAAAPAKGAAAPAKGAAAPAKGAAAPAKGAKK
jgi:large subunit ribosomal protein L10e